MRGSKLFGWVVLATMLGPSMALAGSSTYDFVNNPGATLNYTDAEDVSQFSRISVQGVYADGTPANHTFSDGAKSSVNFTFPGLSSLSARVAQSSITVVDNSAVTGVILTICGQTFREGTEFFKGTVSSMTAESLRIAISSHPSTEGSHPGTTSVVFASAAVSGVAGNDCTAATSNSNAIHIQGPTMTGGQDNAELCINGTCLVQGTAWTVGASSVSTALAVHNAIRDNAAISAVVVSTPGAFGVLFATATTSGTNAYTISISTRGIAASVPFFSGGLVSDVSVANDTIAKTSHTFTTGLRMWPKATAGTLPTGLTAGTTYFAIKYTDDLYKVASSSMNAVAGTAVDITDVTGGGTLVFVVTPLTTGVSTGFKWQASNDGTNYSDLSVSSVTYTAAGNTLWDLGAYNYKYIRMNVIGPTNGALNLKAYLNGITE